MPGNGRCLRDRSSDTTRGGFRAGDASSCGRFVHFRVEHPSLSGLACAGDFEFDADKSRQNEAKHGLDFVAAQFQWRDPCRIEIPARTIGEFRMATIASLGKEVWTAIWTPRGDAIRLISIRRARANERNLYEG